MSLNRVDYIIEYPTMVQFIKKSENIKENFIQYPIKNANNLIALYIGCSKTPNSKKLIKIVNRIIDTNGHKIINSYKKLILQKLYKDMKKN